jgi:protein phosphatase 1K
MPRVNGRLAMTRSLGDFDVKPYGVIATPETTLLKIDHRVDAFLELHTDGVSHVMSGNELGFIARMCSDPDQAANALTSCALQYGTEDNVTAVVVPLGAWGKFCSSNFTKNNIMRINCI